MHQILDLREHFNFYIRIPTSIDVHNYVHDIVHVHVDLHVSQEALRTGNERVSSESPPRVV